MPMRSNPHRFFYVFERRAMHDRRTKIKRLSKCPAVSICAIHRRMILSTRIHHLAFQRPMQFNNAPGFNTGASSNYCLMNRSFAQRPVVSLLPELTNSTSWPTTRTTRKLEFSGVERHW